MENAKGNSALKRVRSQYRLVVINEDTFEELTAFKLTRASVYILLSTIFVLMIGVTAALIVLTPLKYYLPGTGYGNAKEIRAYQTLKIRTDSMELALKYQNTYLKNIESVLKGNISTLDTTKLSLPKTENIDK